MNHKSVAIFPPFTCNICWLPFEDKKRLDKHKSKKHGYYIKYIATKIQKPSKKR